MKKILPALALAAAAALPLAAVAQSPAPASGPSGDMRAQMMQLRDSTRSAAFNDLSADHRTRIMAIVSAVNNGQQTDLRAAAQQIDAILSPDEQKAVLGERTKMMQTMRANRPMGGPGGQGGAGGAAPGQPNAGVTPGGPGPNMGPGGPGRGGPGGRFGNDAGRALLQLAVSPDKMHMMRGHRGDGRGPMPQASGQPQ